MDHYQSDMRLGFIIVGVALMLVGALLLIFIPLGVKQIIGICLIVIIGLGLTVAGSPDPRS